MTRTVTIGLKSKTGRAIAVALTGSASAPEFRLREELKLWDERKEVTIQPYHRVMELPWPDAMTAFGLKPDYGGEERIDDHCPGLERAAESKCEQRCSTKRSRHVENHAESTDGQGGDSQCHKEQETGGEAESIIDACGFRAYAFLGQVGIYGEHRDEK